MFQTRIFDVSRRFLKTFGIEDGGIRLFQTGNSTAGKKYSACSSVFSRVMGISGSFTSTKHEGGSSFSLGQNNVLGVYTYVPLLMGLSNALVFRPMYVTVCVLHMPVC